MGISPVGASDPSPLRAVAVGLKGALRAQAMKSALGDAGLLDEPMASALDGLERSGRSIAAAAIEVAKVKMTGAVLDLLA